MKRTVRKTQTQRAENVEARVAQYFTVEESDKGDLRQTLVTRIDGNVVSSTWTGKTYANALEAANDVSFHNS